MAEETKPTPVEVPVADVTASPEKTAETVSKVEKKAEAEAEGIPVVVEKTEESDAAADEIVKEEKIIASASFKEETNVVEKLPDLEKKALNELKVLVREALDKNGFSSPPPPPSAKQAAAAAEEEEKPLVPPPASTEESKTEVKKEAEAEPKAAAAEEEEKKELEPVAVVVTPPPPTTDAPEETITAEVVVVEATATATATEKIVEEVKETVAVEKEEASPTLTPEEISIWGIPLLADDRTDTILLKFLRARDFKVKDAFNMLKSVITWRKEFKIEKPLDDEETFPITGLNKVVFLHGVDKQEHPVCYNVYGEFQDKKLYQNAFSDAEKRSKFLRWRIQFLEKSITTKLDFNPDGICSFVQVNDLKNSHGLYLFKKELRQATNQALQLLQDNYPEFVAKQVFINVPWWYVTYNRMISPFLTTRTKSKFVFVGPSKTTDALFKYISPEQVPIQYGGLSRVGETQFSTVDIAIEETIKPSSKHTIEIHVIEGSTLVWEARVLGWEVSYGAEFVPNDEGHYTMIIQKTKKIGPTDEPVISGSYKAVEPGKVVIVFDNQTSKKKKFIYRSKNKFVEGS